MHEDIIYRIYEYLFSYIDLSYIFRNYLKFISIVSIEHFS